ncbi:MAG TPA: TlpA disulfide reductase family protein [Pyrinomonadaceae bacterium]|nr:TlpA disulfide reductase family protein [Pyrinomonadaceae bacterium]
MLIKEVAQDYAGQVEFVSENWGESRLAERYGVKRYPVVFVDDVLVAGPGDFGWLGTKGKYTPWRDEVNHEKFKKDLKGMIELVRRGQKPLAINDRSSFEEGEILNLPGFQVRDLEGRQIASAALQGKVVIVEFWATWCPPCRTTLGWLGETRRRFGDQIVILAVATESEETEVRKLTAPLDRSINVVMGSPELVSPFGSLGSVPRMFVFDRRGRTAGAFYGAPPDLHERVNRLIGSLIE